MSAYYNENDAEKAAWIRELIKRNIVAPGDVDERSIVEVRADDLKPYAQCHFFAGIAVWSYALRLAGWSDDRPCWTGSCPCPSFSSAGKGEGFDDARHLWPSWWTIIREHTPPVIFGEQVAAAIRHGWWDLVSTDLESAGYAAASAVLTSASVGGADIRERLYWVADTEISQKRPYDWKSSESESPQKSFGGCDLFGRMADAEHARRDGAVRITTVEDRDESRKRIPERDSTASGMEHTERARSQRHSGNGEASDESGRFGPQQVGSVRLTGSIDGMADADGREQRDRELQRSGERGLIAQDSRVFVEHFAADALKGHWRDADWLFCTDGKWMAVEAGTFPLAYGSPERLGRLRGYGDAINAEVAKAFIEAYMMMEAA